MADRMLLTGAATLATAFAAFLWLDGRHGTLRSEIVPTTITWFLVAVAGFALILARTQRATSSVAGDITWLLLLGLGLRLLMLGTEPTLSDDVYRYLWEGHLVTEGVSPYSFTIDSPLGDQYDIEARTLANNTSLGSPYLPVAHGLFGLFAFLLPSQPWTMQLLMIIFDVLAVAMILQLLSLADLPKQRALLYWLNPLVIVEVAHGAHLDALIIGLGLAGIWLSLRRFHDHAAAGLVTELAGPTLVAAATLTRPLAVLFLPVLFWIWNWRQRVIWGAAFATPVLIAGSATSFGLDGSGVGVFGSARAYTETFRFNSGMYHWLETWIGGRGLDDKGWNEPMALTRLVVFAIVGLAMIVVFVVSRRQTDARASLRLLAVPVMLYVLFTPVLHPWYTLLLLAFVPFLAPGVDESADRWIMTAPWLVLSVLLIFSYLTYEDPTTFAERGWVRTLEWYPTLALLAVAIAVAVGRRFRTPSTDRHTRDATITT